MEKLSFFLFTICTLTQELLENGNFESYPSGLNFYIDSWYNGDIYGNGFMISIDNSNKVLEVGFLFPKICQNITVPIDGIY